MGAEAMDIITDLIFATDLILDDETENATMIGWISVIPLVCGILVFYAKTVLTRKYIGYQLIELKSKMRASIALNGNVKDVNDCTEQIRQRKVDLNMIGLVGVALENIPQIVIVGVVSQSSIGWNIFSVVSLIFSIIMTMVKVVQIVLNKLGCADPSIEVMNDLEMISSVSPTERTLMPIMRPMVITVAIGDYDEEISNEDFDYEPLENLTPGIQNDIVNLNKLLHDRLDYTVCPVMGSVDAIKVRWTRAEFMALIDAKAKEFANNLYDADANKNGFDALFVSISSHGIDQQIITSDYGMVSKKDIYRRFTDSYPASRQLPRVVLFDCCEGSKAKAKGIKKAKKTQTTASILAKGQKEEAKEAQDEEKKNDDDETVVVYEWRKEDENTDFNLAILNSSNLDYTSWMNSVDGSYLIFNFCKKANECLDAAKDVVLSDIFYEIQDELAHDKQLPVYSFNNDTRNVKLVKKEQTAIETEGNDTAALPQSTTTKGGFIE